MPISRTDVEKVAHLARLKFSEDEVSRLADELAAIVGYVETLEAVDTSNVEPQTQFISAENVFREDVARECLPRTEALRNAPRKTEEFFLAPKVIG